MTKETEKKFTEAIIEYAKGFGEWHYAIPCAREGARLFLGSIWHDANELPDTPDTVVIEHGEYGTSVCLACTMSRAKSTIWCYLDDILPDNK